MLDHMKQIQWRMKALRQLRKIKNKRQQAKIYDAVDGLKDFPTCLNVKKLNCSHQYHTQNQKHWKSSALKRLGNAMSAHTPDSVQIIEKDGHPMFAVIPYEDYLNLLPKDERVTVPHEVVGLVVKEGMNLVRAWRKYLGLTQAEVSRRAGISQAALSQMERADNKLRNATLEKLAQAMGLSIDQLTD